MVRAMSKAQRRLMDENFLAFANWLKAGSDGVGVNIGPYQQRVVDAMQRKGFLTERLSVTDLGQMAWKKALANEQRALAKALERQKRA
ncbi:hypothetical protein [Bradyrhizobium sp. SZCCHNR3118]|uniref:hypothetical protein n=1 Tax=Bradyrhizobium sp. SZCCHNR3118 TaxID=3057468 RepID=UPI002916B44D|nr:hypothetical protein [Bradyrhizobium sp. SZCCHNR3118]